MRVYIDFDDVLCETARALSELACKVFQRDVPYEKISVFNLQHAFSLSGDQIEDLMDYAHEIEFLEKLEPAPGAVEALKRLRRKEHDTVIVTGRPSFCHEGSIRWLERFGLASQEIIYVDKYGRTPKTVPDGDFPPTLTPYQFCQLSFDVAIDDSPEALDLLSALDNCRILIYDRPWNQTFKCGKKFSRCSNWHDILRLIDGD
ncbi:MAG: 2-dehydropantoate 2-reductase [Kiritimatiellia bacterium]